MPTFKSKERPIIEKIELNKISSENMFSLPLETKNGNKKFFLNVWKFFFYVKLKIINKRINNDDVGTSGLR